MTLKASPYDQLTREELIREEFNKWSNYESRGN